MSRDSPQDLASLWGSAHVAQHTTLTIATPQPPAAAMPSHEVYCANSPPSFAEPDFTASLHSGGAQAVR